MHTLHKVLRKINANGAAWPVDLFRRALACLALVYFWTLLHETNLISAPTGLLDHRTILDIFPYTFQPLFSESLNSTSISLIYALAMLIALFIIFGIRVRIFSLVLYVISVCAFRWNFLVVYVDDVFMHLFLLWSALLPDGKTQFFGGKYREKALSTKLVSKASIHFFLFNISLMYLVSGLSKWSSPMWVDGTAVFVIQKLSFTRFPAFWQIEMMPILKIFTWSALVVEPIFALIPWLAKGSRLKLGLAILAVFMHLFTILTLGFAFANLACICALLLCFQDELHAFYMKSKGLVKIKANESWQSLRFSDYTGLVVVVLLTGAMSLSFTNAYSWRSSVHDSVQHAPKAHKAPVNPEYGNPLQTAFYGGLWVLGLAQSYQLMDWIDSRNFTIAIGAEIFKANEKLSEEENLEKFLPSTVRVNLLYSYIFEVVWHSMPKEKLEVLKKALVFRLSNYLCRHEKTKMLDKDVRLNYSLFRISPQHLETYVPVFRKNTLLDFSCKTEGISQIHLDTRGQL